MVGESALFDVYFTEEEIVDYRSTLSADKEKLTRFNRLLLKHGVFKGDTKYYVSTVHDDDDVETTLNAFSAAIEELDC